MKWQAHHVIVAASYPFNADTTNPFLDAVSSGFVKWPETVDVEIYFFITEMCKLDFGGYAKCRLFVGCGDCDSGDYIMDVA